MVRRPSGGHEQCGQFSQTQEKVEGRSFSLCAFDLVPLLGIICAHCAHGVVDKLI